jgi:hypothetical protein
MTGTDSSGHSALTDEIKRSEPLNEGNGDLIGDQTGKRPLNTH